MGLNSAFSNAFSGLNVSARRAELVSNNISNAMTESFARREISLSSDVLNGHGGGVRVDDVVRVENKVLSGSRRAAEVKLEATKVEADFASQISQMIGKPGDLSAFAEQYSSFEAALVTAANDPSNQIQLDNAVLKAKDIATSLNRLSEGANELRLQADGEISRQVKELNVALDDLAKLNVEIRKRAAAGSSINGLKDQQSILVDKVNKIIPVKLAEKEFGEISLFTPNGGILLSDKAGFFEFTGVAAMSHGFSVGNGTLSDLVLNGANVTPSSDSAFFGGGTLGKLFKVRDEVLPDFNNQLDALASDVTLRFQDPAVDPTLSANSAGLFTDGGSQFLSANRLGFAGRISLNSSIDVSSGGESWKIRAGIEAINQGEVGDASILANYRDAFRAVRSPEVGMAATSNSSAVNFASFFASQSLTNKAGLDEKLTSESAGFSELKQAELGATAVDTDRELQSLIEVENAYAANARVMAVLENLIAKLLEI